MTTKDPKAAGDSTINLDLKAVRAELVKQGWTLKARAFTDPLVIINSGKPHEPRFSVSALMELLEQGSTMGDDERAQHVFLFRQHASDLSRKASEEKDPTVAEEIMEQALECAAIGRLFQYILIGGLFGPSR